MYSSPSWLSSPSHIPLIYTTKNRNCLRLLDTRVVINMLRKKGKKRVRHALAEESCIQNNALVTTETIWLLFNIYGFLPSTVATWHRWRFQSWRRGWKMQKSPSEWVTQWLVGRIRICVVVEATLASSKDENIKLRKWCVVYERVNMAYEEVHYFWVRERMKLLIMDRRWI